MRPSTGARTRRKLSVQLVSQQLKEDVPDSAFARVDSDVKREAAAPPAPVQLFLDSQEVLGVLDSSAEAQECAFKARLGCAPSTTPVVSAAFGEYAGAFQIGSPSGRAIGDEKGAGHKGSAGAGDTAVASPRL